MTCNQLQAHHILSRNMVSSVQKPSITKCSQEATNMAGRAGVCNIASNLSKSVANTRNKKLLHSGSGSSHQKNGIVVVPKCSANSMHHNSSWHSTDYKPPLPPKTEGGHTSDQSSLTNQSNSKRLVCPELTISYTNTLIANRVGQLNSRQQDVEDMLSSLKKKLRRRQLNLVHVHSATQVESHNACPKPCRKLTLSESTVSAASPTEHAQFDEPVEPMDSAPSECTSQTLPLQVDGACDDAFVVKAEGDREPVQFEKKQTPSIAGESFCSMDSLESVQSDDGLIPNVTHIRQRLRSLEAIVDDELTESSSDEEEESTTRWRREGSKRNWERIKTAVGTRWSWLEHRIVAINKELCRLENEIQHRPSKEKFTFAAPPNPSHSSYFALPNGSFLDHFHKGGNGSLVSAAAAASGVYKGVVTSKPSNGFGHNLGGGTPPNCLPHLLLPDNLLGSKLQVKDLLSPSPLGRNFVFIDEGGYSSARTRPLERRAHRRIVRKPKLATRRETLNTCDPSQHPKLTLPHELPSRILLDRAIKRITEEHSYAQLPLSKRRKAASSLSHSSSSRQLSFTPRYDYSFSTSPSPSATPLSAGSLDRGKGSSRKNPQLVHHHSTSSTDLQSPWSPNMSRPSTPTLTPLQHHPKRKRMLSSTPSYDIDNIVIPYSMASSTRLEKPEYKEIVTPSWREIVNGKEDDSVVSEEPMKLNSHKKSNHTPRGSKTPVLKQEEEEEDEDCSDEAFSRRHEKCELQEKKRFINFITGGQRKRSRPQSLSSASTPDASITGTPHPLSASKGKPPHKRVLMSPPPLEGECTRRSCGVLPWLPREFPLSKTDEDALYNPPPPPKPIRITPSPSPMHTRSSTPTDFKTPSSTSTLATPLSSPLSTPSEESRVISPVEWMVINSQLHNGNHIGNTNQKHSDSTLSSSSSIILKLAKRT